MNALESRAPEWCELLKANAEITNLPRVGIHRNVAYPTMQLNISPAVPWKSSEWSCNH